MDNVRYKIRFGSAREIHEELDRNISYSEIVKKEIEIYMNMKIGYMSQIKNSSGISYTKMEAIINAIRDCDNYMKWLGDQIKSK